MKIFSDHAARLVASGFGSGYSPVSPGTAGSAAAAFLWILLLRLTDAVEPHLLAWMLTVAALAAGAPATARAISMDRNDDPSWVVIDEWAGVFLVFAIAPQSDLFGVFLGFALFRVFDIIKLGPVGWAERIKGAWGVLSDDLVAGFLAALVLIAVR